jgi:uncharacterized membrane protein YkoI
MRLAAMTRWAWTAVMVALLGGGPALADSRHDDRQESWQIAQRDQGRRVSPDQAVEIARRQTGGRVLAVRESRDGYQVKVLTPKGEVRYVFVPSGR